MIHQLTYVRDLPNGYRRYRCDVCCQTVRIVPGRPAEWDDCPGPGYVPTAVAIPPKPDKPVPSLAEQAAHLAKDAVVWAAHGFPVASRIEQRRRLSQCERPCEEHQRGRCVPCGCHTSWKAWTETGKCPLDKWKPHKDRWSDEEIHAYMQRDPATGRTPLRPILRRNLLFHVYATGEWRWHVERLSGVMDQFNGRRIVALALADEAESPEIVRAAFGRKQHSIEFIEVKNDKRLREVASFARLLAEVESTHHYEATFYGHTKGNSTGDDSLGAELWTRTAYCVLLADPKRIGDVLRCWPAAGINFMRWPDGHPVYPTKLDHGRWMFAGTFFWFRHDAVYSRDWNSVPDDRYGAEAWLSGVLPWQDAFSAYQAWTTEEAITPTPYDPWMYLDEVCR